MPNARREMKERAFGMKRWSLLLLLALATVSAPSSMEAANWKVVGEGGAVTIYIDTASISGGQAGPREAWLKTEYGSPNCSTGLKNKCIANFLSYERYFSDKSFCTLEVLCHFSDGTDQRLSFSCRPVRLSPDSLGELVWKYLYPSPEATAY